MISILLHPSRRTPPSGRVKNLVFPGRFELPAWRLGGARSIHLSYGNAPFRIPPLENRRQAAAPSRNTWSPKPEVLSIVQDRVDPLVAQLGLAVQEPQFDQERQAFQRS